MNVCLQASSLLQLSAAFAHFDLLDTNYLQSILNMCRVVNILGLIFEHRPMLRSLELFLLGSAARSISKLKSRRQHNETMRKITF
jgi:hypothetical protein